jgi:hypothetical protein
MTLWKVSGARQSWYPWVRVCICIFLWAMWIQLCIALSISNQHLLWCDNRPYLSPMLKQWKTLPLNGSCLLSQSLELEMGDIPYFKNTLSFLISVISLIVDSPFFLGIANYGFRESHSEELSSSRTSVSTNLTTSLLYCNYSSIDLGTLYARAWIGLQLGSINWRQIGSMLNSPNVPSNRCSYFGVIIEVDAVSLHGGSHVSCGHHLSLLAHTQHQEFR